MRVLMITGDKSLLVPGTPGFARLELQRSQVEELALVYWGRGSLWPSTPKGRFDVVTVQDPFWRGLFAWKIARHLNARFNVQVHTDLTVQSFWRHILAQIVLRHADSVRVVSLKIKKQVENIGMHAAIHVLPIFIDVSRFRVIQRQPHEKKTIIWVGRFEKEKDPMYALSVLKEVRNAGIEAKLVMLGAGSIEKDLKHRAKGFQVEFPGWQDSAVYLGRADVVLSTSRHESWGASIIEALAAGVPVVAPDVGVAREAGAIVAPRLQLAQKIIEALQTEARGYLQLHLPTREEWATQWRNTL